jgi:NodT family efflux transporter outer membrane factor (OMF) lipoprotein
MLWNNQLMSYGILRKYAVVVVLCFSALAGCTVGPNYKPPQPRVPASWSGPTVAAGNQPTTVAAEDIIHWWTTFGDQSLTSLVERAVNSNLDLKQAEARILQARAARGIVTAGLWPSAAATGSFTRSHSPATTTPGGSGGVNRNLYQAGLDAAWELDMFGGVRRDVEAANADVLAALEDRQGVLVTLAAEVALNYIDLRGFQQQIVIAQDNLKAQKHSAELTRKRFQGGFVGALDVANADAQVATTASQIPLLESSARQAIYNLSVLLGREPSALLEELSPTSIIPVAPPSVPVGVPSDLLRRRPDIRRAEAQIHSATARIGVATADLFPKVSLSGTGGLQGSQSNALTNWNNRFWSFGPSASWQVFDAGRIGSNIELQKALKEQSFIAYQQTVLTALQDVENALIASAKEQEHRNRLMEAVAASRKAVDLATQLYTEGQTDFLNVLAAQRSLYTSEDALVQSNRNVSTNLVALYKALGGGWNDKSP